jgi:hypothetical protein
VSFATVTLCVASQQVVVVDFVINSVWKLLDTHLYLKKNQSNGGSRENGRQTAISLDHKH